MIYTFIGNKDFIEKEVKNIEKDYGSEEIVYYNLENDSINLVIEDLNTISLFGNKLVIVNNLDKLKEDEALIKYLDNPSSNTLILTSLKELDKRKKITKVLNEKTKLKQVFKLDLTNYIKNALGEYKMDFITINLLINYTLGNINRIDNELEKLKMYKLDDKTISSEDIKKVVNKSYDSTIFDLIDYINTKDVTKVLKTYEEIKREGEEPDKIMYTIANHYRLLFEIKNKLTHMSDDEIINEYSMHPYRFSKLKQQASILTNGDILKMLKAFGDIDIEVKKSSSDIDNSLVIFFKTLN